MTTSYKYSAQDCSANLTRAIVRIPSLAAHTTLKIYKPMEISIRGHLNNDAQARDRTRNFLLTRTTP